MRASAGVSAGMMELVWKSSAEGHHGRLPGWQNSSASHVMTFLMA
ncbi:hypothetical protein SACS_0255 [Parasaccharibacter apium]|uniref:Uncharacterized protein n=1 Tax=Parasaccharibacter apium TaxID=1510841 RepID=A0A7U7G4J0_9PROT|nr:hypothetical protein SACS_0255 [Parasaccharibacter apium]